MRRYEFELLARALGKVRDIKAGSYEIAQPVDAAASCSTS